MINLCIRKCKPPMSSTVKTLLSNRPILYMLAFAFISLSCGSGAYVAEQNRSNDDLISESTGSIYPHADGFTDPDSHGLYTLANDIQSCEICHGDDLQGGTSMTSCFTCHASYPHAKDWEIPEGHGLYSISNGKDPCQGCHGTDYLGGRSSIACRDCHDPYPHAAEWVEWDNHGNYVLTNSTSTCAGVCHGTDFKGGDTNVPCFDCHKPYPHNAEWTNMSNTSNHGRYYVENYVLQDVSNEECASNCHGTDFRGGGAPVSCDSCHDDGIFPHADEGEILWEITGHQNKVNSLGSDALCTECHSDYNKGAFGGELITCTSYCHQ
jgi:hypothetical protein